MATSPPEGKKSLPSCNGCKQRKLKCSREVPVCANCKRLDVSCEYEGKKNKPGMKSGVVDQLTRRIADLEHKLYDDGDSRERPISSSPASQSVQCGVTLNNDTTPKISADLCGLSTQIQHLSSSIGNLVSAMRLPDDINSSLEPARKRARVDSGFLYENHSLRHSPIGDSHTQYQSSNGNILEGRILSALVDAFFQHVARWIPMVQENAFRRKLLKRKPGDPLPLLVHAMVVGALRILNVTERVFSEAELEEKIEYAMTKVLLASNTKLSVESLQSLIIVAFTLLISGEHAKAWPIIGSLTRSIEYLQLSVEEREQEAQAALLSPYLLPSSVDWVEEEERRRVFWNVFILDRICSATAGYRIALTGDNVWRRLPLCGTHWNTENFAVSPYFGIWDKSAGKIDSSIAFLPQHYPSPEQSTTVSTDCSEGINMDTVGAFAYYVEALESLCRVDVYFLRQKVDFSNRDELSSWLTRFKELDMRLVHWKMFLPSKWKDPDVPPEETGRLDPNMTLAHITHNTSTILLHQRIGYPEEQLKDVKLPTFFSAETCRLAAGEIATIARKYLASSSHLMPLSPQFCFCLCISGRVLLVHWQHYGPKLDSFFWVLVEALDEAARRCHSSSQRGPSLAGLFAGQLRQLHSQVKEDPDSKIHVLDSFGGTQKQGTRPDQSVSASLSVRNVGGVSPSVGGTSSRNDGFARGSNTENVPFLNFPSSSSPMGDSMKNKDGLEPAALPKPSANLMGSPPLMDCTALTDDSLSGILDALGDSAFMDMDRVISFSDLDFS